jgi:hypothetical protein
MAPRWIGGQKIPAHPIETLAQPQWARPSEREPDADAWYRNRRDEVGKTCPVALEVWTLMDIAMLRRVHPLEMHLMERAAEPFIDAHHAIEHYAAHGEHGAGLVTGQQDPSWGFLALHADLPNAWVTWLHEHGQVERQGEVGGKEDWGSRVVTFHEIRPFGQPALVSWQEVPSTDPYQMPRTTPVVQGVGVDQIHRLQLLESLTAGPASRWLLFPYQGSRTWKRRRLGDGLELLAPGATVPVAGVGGDYRVVVHGSLARPEANAANVWLPDWLAVKFCGRAA